MPCPLFIPTAPLGELNPGPTPLGDLFTGQCAVDRSFAISPELLACCCHFGYARSRCERARQSPDDATCFVISRVEPGAVEVRWSLERDHHPVSVGEYIVSGFDSPQDSQPLTAQATAYVSVFQKRTSKV